MRSSASMDTVPRYDMTARALLDALDDPAMLVDRGVVQLANSAARALVGETIEGSDVRLAIRQPQALDLVLAGKPGDMDFTGIGAVGRPWRLTVRALGNGALLVRLIDRSAAHAAEKMRVDFVANASHELRTPLTAILGYAESLEDGDAEPQLAAKFAATIRAEAARMLRIIEDLMSLSRIEADRFVAPTDRLSVEPVIRNAAERVREAVEANGCSITVDLEDDLPEIPGDRAQIGQLFDNLLSNAARYGCAEKGDSIRITARKQGRSIRFEVIDTGPGIPRAHLPFVSRRFYRVDEARSRGTGGTGLGLAIVKHIVERHRGTWSIDSSPGEGTRVTVALPSA